MTQMQPVPPEVLAECAESARFWSQSLPRYGSRMRRLADNYVIAGSLLSTVSGLAVWVAITKSEQVWGQVLVSAMALASAFVVTVPKTRGYATCGEQAMDLANEYGTVLGDLLEAEFHPDPAKGHEARKRFEGIRARKEKLSPYPEKLKSPRDERASS